MVPMISHGFSPQVAAGFAGLTGLAAIAGRGAIGCVFGRLYGGAFGIFLIASGTEPVLASSSFDYFASYRPGALLFAAATLVVVLLTFAMPSLPTTLATDNLPHD